MRKRVASLVFGVMILASTTPSFGLTREEASRWTYGNVSPWAKNELIDAVANDIVLEPDIFIDCKKDITRKEFSTLAVNLYRAIKQEDPAPAPAETFSDTMDTSVRIAYNLGIINGVGNGKFSPDSPITREQMGVIVRNVVNALGVAHHRADGVLEMADKGQVSPWAVEGVDFVHENGFMQGNGVLFSPKSNTPVQQAVSIVNRVYKEYGTEKKVQAPKPKVEEKVNDYTQGIQVAINTHGLHITYSNTRNTETLFGAEDHIFITDGAKIQTRGCRFAIASKDNRYIYFIDGDKQLTKYDMKTEEYTGYGYELGLVYSYNLIEDGKYKGYIITRPTKEIAEYRVFDNRFQELGTVSQIDYANRDNTVEEAIANTRYKETAFNFTVNGDNYYDATIYGGIWNFGEKLGMKPDSVSEGPMALVTDMQNNIIIHEPTGSYSAEIVFNNNQHSNAGIVFNVTSAQKGNDQYKGYYVGINPEANTLMVGLSNYKWHKLEEKKLAFDIRPGVTYNLQVKNRGDKVDVYIDDVYELTVNTGHINSRGYLGLRGWKADVDYKSFTAY